VVVHREAKQDHEQEQRQPVTGAEKGQLMNTDGKPILINGLWALRFGNGTFATDGTLLFTAGIGDESHGLLGEITPAG
jgi:hypothetical protein